MIIHPPPQKKKYIYVVQCWKVKMQKTNEDWPSLTIRQSYDLQSPNPYKELAISGLSDMSGSYSPSSVPAVFGHFLPSR